MASRFHMSSTTAFSVLLMIASLFARTQSADFNIMKYGVKADGSSDIMKPLMDAWKEICMAPGPSKLTIPAGKYLLSQVALGGPCKGPITIQVDGTILAPPDASNIKGDGWVVLKYVEGLTVTGKGTFDGQGASSWKNRGECTKSFSCSNHPTNIRLDFLTNSVVEGITSVNSKMFHYNVLGCKNITLRNLIINAPEDSVNTDGIHVGRSDGVTIINPNIKTGDDCISMGDGSKNLNISGVTCGPGHGISVGSLGRLQNEQDVTGIYVRNCTLTKTMWGVRVKTWPASPPGVATDMHFEDIKMIDVPSPVLIDQVYCPWNQCKANIPSKVKVSKVSFKNIKGTSTTKKAVELSCSPALPCEGVEIADISLKNTGSDGPVASNCTNVKPTITGTVPPGC